MPEALLDQMISAAVAAGEVILSVYETAFATEAKADGSPVTEADQRAEDTIIAILTKTGLPSLGEESVAAGHIPELGNRYFIVDPLDGTKEFIKRNGEFTVNIALIDDGLPIFGVVLAPALGVLYAGSPDGAFKQTIAGKALSARQPIEVAGSGPINIVASRSHGHAALVKLMAHFSVEDDVSVGSSLKFCLLAEGRARLYPRFTPTCEWDTAAGHAVLGAAGGTVLAIDGKALRYGKGADGFLNPLFAAADREELAREAVGQMRQALA